MGTFIYCIMLLMVLSLTWIVYQIKKSPIMDDNGHTIHEDEKVENRKPLWDDNKQHTENFF